MKENEIIRQFSCNKEEHETFMKKLEELGQGQEEIKLAVAKLPEVLADKFDQRYASKRTEKALDKIMWIIITAVIVGLLTLIFK